MNDPTRIHIGLNNIRRRLEYICDNQQTMEINSQPGEGTAMRITFPFSNPD